jgi:L-histidine N-alpha-methyltransferase
MSTQPSASSKTERVKFATSVREGLAKGGQKELHSQYLYDDLGSALFDAITCLPEYGLTRADVRLLEAHAAEISDSLPPCVRVAELGSGSGSKTRHILEALASRVVAYHPIDVSSAALARCEKELASYALVSPIGASYLDGLRDAATQRTGEGLLVLFLGSSIGNFERGPGLECLRGIRRQLRPGDALLLGADLVKDPETMLLAYDDPTGVTAAFNLNLLGRVNRELGGTFDLRTFDHEARYNASERRIEMHVRSRVQQTVTIPGADCSVSFDSGETIWTESSHKYDLSEIDAMAEASGFAVSAQWVDREWPFVESLWRAL